MIWEGTLEKTDLSWAFCYQASIGLQYKLTDHLHVLVDFSSFNATPRKTFPSSDLTSAVTKKYDLNTINAMAGIGVNF